MKMKKPQNGENLPIRNSTAEFLVFAKEAGADTIAVRFQDEMLWLTQPLICQLFDVAKSTVSEHLSNISQAGSLRKRQLFGNTEQFEKRVRGKLNTRAILISSWIRSRSRRRRPVMESRRIESQDGI